MTNNTNVNLAGKLFAYIQHGVDVNENIAAQYRNSLIFIGDEKQIYVPAKNAYVGIGQSNFNNALNAISALEHDLNELKNSTRSATVQRIYPQYSPWNMASVIGNAEITAYSSLTGNIEISVLGDYDPDTHWARTSYIVPVEDGTQATTEVTWHAANTQPTSGLRISYVASYSWKTDENTGLLYKEPGTQRLIIDDTQTWSYMTSAYSYTLDFTRDYTNLQIETLYHDLLGIGEDVLVPVDNSSMWYHDPATNTDVFIGGTFYEWNDNSTPVMPISLNDSETPSSWTMPDGKANHWVAFDGTGTYNSNHEYFKISKNYNNTYNMDIANGIQTLKEVAYILDQLSDGGIGSTTYITRSEWESISGLTKTNDTLNTYTATIGETVVSYYRVYSYNKPTTNASAYGYWIDIKNPENLGIQIAYSIAGNKADIEDLHDHVKLAEFGETTLRSLAADSTDMITVSMFSSHPALTKTDTDAELTPNVNASTYELGDMRLVLGLDLASTYIYTTSDTTALQKINGVEYYGIYQKVNMSDVAGKAIPANTYYTKDGNSFAAVEAQTAPSIDQIINDGMQWYYIGESKNDPYINSKFELVDQVTFANLPSNRALFKEDTANDTMDPGPAGSTYTKGTVTFEAGTYYIMTDSGNANTVHAYVGSNTGTNEERTALNKIATTAWTIALIDDKNTEIAENLENIKSLAYAYTTSKINALDWQMAYSQFNWDDAIAAGMTNITKSGLIEGSDAYKVAEEQARQEWLNKLNAQNANNIFMTQEDNALFTYAYITNKLRSQYISNIVEEDGIVKVVDTNELPTDMLDIHTEVWGNQDSSTAKSFTAIDLTGVTIPQDDPEGMVEASDLEKLFYAVNAQDKHQAFYSDGTNTYEKLAAGTTATTSDYIYDPATGTYVTLVGHENELNAWNRNKPGSPYYTQVYRLGTAYYEVDLATITVNTATGAITSFEYGCYDSTNSNYDSSVGRCKWTGDATPTLYFATNNATKSTNYITGTIQHYDYTTYGGEGQNKVSLTTHITYLEDATPTNTGLVDAYDVASFIDNMCEWVDLSASVNDAVLLERDAFYESYVFATVPSDGDHADGSFTGTWYVLNTGNGTKYVAAATVNYKAYGKDSGGAVVAWDNASKVPGSDFWSFVDGNTLINAYTRNQNASTNALNLTLTKYGA